MVFLDLKQLYHGCLYANRVRSVVIEIFNTMIG